MIQPFNPQIDQQIASLNQNRGRGGSPAVDPRVLRQSEEARDQDFMLQAAGMRAGIGNAQLQSRTALEAARMGADSNLKAAQMQSETWKSQHNQQGAEADQRHQVQMAQLAAMERQRNEDMERYDREREESQLSMNQVATGAARINAARSELLAKRANNMAGLNSNHTAALEGIGKKQRSLQSAFGRAVLAQSNGVESVRRDMRSRLSFADSSSKAYGASAQASAVTWSEVARDINDPTWDGRDPQNGLLGTVGRWVGGDNRKYAPDGTRLYQMTALDDENSQFWKSRGYHKDQWETTRKSTKVHLGKLLVNGTKDRDPQKVAHVVDDLMGFFDGVMNGTRLESQEIQGRVARFREQALQVGINPQTIRAAVDAARKAFTTEAETTFEQLREVVPDSLAYLGPVGIDDDNGNLRPLLVSELMQNKSAGDALFGENLLEQAPTIERLNAFIDLSNGMDRLSSLLGAGGIEDQADLDQQVFIIRELVGGLDSSPRFTDLSGESLDAFYAQYGDSPGPGGMSMETLVDALMRSSGEGAYVPLAATPEEARDLIQTHPVFQELAGLVEQYGGYRKNVREAHREMKFGSSSMYDWGDDVRGMEGLEDLRQNYTRDHNAAVLDENTRAEEAFNALLQEMLADETLTPEAMGRLAELGLGVSFGDMARME